MKLYHATLQKHTESILEQGLLPEKALGKIKGVWLHTASKREWAVLHTMKRHNVTMDDVVIIEVKVPRSALTRRWRGLWSCERVIPVAPADIRSAVALSASPLAEVDNA